MDIVSEKIISDLHKPDKFSHKGQNGKLLIIGGSSLFHGASLWALKTASRIVDMVFYLSIPKNQEYADYLNKQLYDFINISFQELDSYIKEADVVLLGPGMTRTELKSLKVKEFKIDKNFEDTYRVTDFLLHKYPDKRWVLDAGALQSMDAEWLKELKEVIITPHRREFIGLFGKEAKISSPEFLSWENKDQKSIEAVWKVAKRYGCTIVLKGQQDIICNPNKWVINQTGNEGLTKGGTGDVLAGLIAALACKNDLFLAAAVGAYINGLAGDQLYQTAGSFFNASDQCDQIPRTLHRLLEK
jgi:NAD(P)H-hydrate epimerase